MAIKDKGLDTSCIQSEQVSIESNYIYGFDRQRMFKSGYIARSKGISQGHGRYDVKNIGYKGSLLAKDKWNQFHCIVFFWQ